MMAKTEENNDEIVVSSANEHKTSVQSESEQTVNEEDEEQSEVKDAEDLTVAETKTIVSGTKLDDFEVVQTLGEGGYGKVVLVRKKEDKSSNGKLYAMKILPKAQNSDKRRINSIKTEREILATIKHPNVVRLLYAFQSERRLFFVLEYCQGKGDLKDSA